MNQHEPRLKPPPFACASGPVRRTLALGSLCALSAVSSAAFGQTDIVPKMPNVLLLVDTSGSMEYKTGSQTFPQCKYNATTTTGFTGTPAETSRWIDLVQVMTGSITNYQCQDLDRSSAAFQNEYKLSGLGTAFSGTSPTVDPYDFLYANNYHRPLSGTCAPGPGAVNATTPATFPVNAIKYHDYNNTGSAACTFAQASDGILDAFKDGVRFGLMTFDTDPGAATDQTGGFSYFVGASKTGLPILCTDPPAQHPFEVGARGPGAPPWEGRLIPFGDPAPGSGDFLIKNQQIQQVLQATRPYGATPIAGMLADARKFLWEDVSKDTVNTALDFGPANDPYKSCRSTAIILLTDGKPNMDLAGNCDNDCSVVTGRSCYPCPYPPPETTADALLTDPSHNQVPTYVIGFALNSVVVGGVTVDCSKLVLDDFKPGSATSLCATNASDDNLQACCTLNRIAYAGGHPTKGLNLKNALFASDSVTLAAQLQTILKSTASTTSRTVPVFSSGSSTRSDFAASYRFFTGVVPKSFAPWSATLTRERWVCDPSTQIPAPQTPPNPELGDDFVANVNSGTGRARTFYSVQGTNTGSVFSSRSIRPQLTTDPDGVGNYSGTQYTAGAAAFVTATTPESMSLTSTSCTGLATAALCRDRYMKWLVGIANGTINTRCPNGVCDLVGDIIHSTPEIVGPPNQLLRDESYTQFASDFAQRPLVLYASTNDGFLHAFKVASNDPLQKDNDQENVKKKNNNELWAFIPPAVLPLLPGQYPINHQALLDGAPIIKDVVAKVDTTKTYPFVFERTSTDAQSGGGKWRTILLQSFGASYPGYFALDVTQPDPLTKDGTRDGGPVFLWQLTTDAAGNALFGTGGGTPLITTLFFADGGADPKEIPVAVLPGGPAPNAGAGCVRQRTDFSADFPGLQPRTNVPCYTTNLGGRSLTIVRLDTGKIIRTFRRAAAEVPAGTLQTLVTATQLDSPITGQPVAFPSETGSVADRVYVGDADGGLWKLDLSSTTPSSWTMKLFWDTFPRTTLKTAPIPAWNTGQPIATAPILSVDSVGNISVNVSTGDQNAVGFSSGMYNYVWSLIDKPQISAGVTTRFADPQWYEQFLNGERVTGPISLFNSALFFTTLASPDPGITTDPNVLCKTGTSTVWGMHYLNPNGGSVLGNDGGTPALQLTAGTVQKATAETLGVTGATIFGATVAQQPSCSTDDTSFNDQYLGYGSHSSISGVRPGKFQLLMHIGTGSVPSSTAGVTAPSGVGANAVSVDLKSPVTTARIDSWAAILE